jgi:hypothetical protein
MCNVTLCCYSLSVRVLQTPHIYVHCQVNSITLGRPLAVMQRRSLAAGVANTRSGQTIKARLLLHSEVYWRDIKPCCLQEDQRSLAWRQQGPRA